MVSRVFLLHPHGRTDFLELLNRLYSLLVFLEICLEFIEWDCCGSVDDPGEHLDIFIWKLAPDGVDVVLRMRTWLDQRSLGSTL